MRIAMLGHKRIPSREGGIEVVVGKLTEYLSGRGEDVVVFNRSGHNVSGRQYDEQKKNYGKHVKIVTVPTPANKTLNAFVYSVFATIRACLSECDVIHFHAEGPAAMTWLPHLLGIPVVTTIHGLDWQRNKWGAFASRYLKFGEKQAVKYSDELIVLSDNAKKYFKDVYGRDTILIPNGVDTSIKRGPDLIRERYSLTKDGYYLFLGRLVPEKGVHTLIEAFQKLETDKKLVIAGGISGTSEYAEEIKKKALADKRIIFTDFVSGNLMDELFTNAYCYVFPSTLEGMPISLLEALSYGNCCLTSNIPECTEVTDGEEPVFEAGNTISLLDALEDLEESPEIVSMYKDAAEGIADKYSWEKACEEALEIYRKAIREKKAHRSV